MAMTWQFFVIAGVLARAVAIYFAATDADENIRSWKRLGFWLIAIGLWKWTFRF